MAHQTLFSQLNALILMTLILMTLPLKKLPLSKLILRTCLLLGLLVQPAVALETSDISFSRLQNRPAIYIQINNADPKLVLVDTGYGGELMLDDKVAIELGLKHLHTNTVNNMGMGNIEIENYEAAQVQVGNSKITINKVQAQKTLHRMLNQMGTDAKGNKPVGIISPWVLTKGTITFNAKHNLLSIDHKGYLTATSPSTQTYLFDKGIPYFDVTIAGKSYTAHLDTGSPAPFILPATFRDQLAFTKQPQQNGGAQTAGRAHKLWTATLDGKIEAGNVKVENPNLLLIEGIPSVNIGMNAFNDGVITVDPTNQFIQFN